jgi:hypothetical protein
MLRPPARVSLGLETVKLLRRGEWVWDRCRERCRCPKSSVKNLVVSAGGPSALAHRLDRHLVPVEIRPNVGAAPPKGWLADFEKNFSGSSTLDSQGTRKGGLAMFHYDQSHPEWEMAPETQRKLALGVAVAAALVVLINLVGGAGPNIWDQLRPDGVAHSLTVVRF